MSGSPKYCSAQLREEQERRLREERKRQAEIERARRAAEEEKRRKENLAKAQNHARQETTNLMRQITTFANEEAARLVSVELEALKKNLHKLENDINRAGDAEQLKRSENTLRRFRDDLRQITAQGEAARLAAHLAHEEAAVIEIKNKFSAFDQTRSEKFDVDGFREARRLISAAESALNRKVLSETEKIIAEVRIRLERHQATVEKRFSQWFEEKERCNAALESASNRLVGLKADVVVLRWGHQEVNAIEKRLGQISSIIETEKFSLAQNEAKAVLEGMENILIRVQELQLKEDRRRYIADGIIQVMNQMGFIVQAGSPTLEKPDSPVSDMIIQARRLGGGAIAVSVPQDGDIWYDVAGLPMREENGEDGKLIKSCDEAEEQIEKMHEKMEEVFGIQMSELMWEDKDPNRIHKPADRLPEAKPAARQKGGV